MRDDEMNISEYIDECMAQGMTKEQAYRCADWGYGWDYWRDSWATDDWFGIAVCPPLFKEVQI